MGELDCGFDNLRYGFAVLPFSEPALIDTANAACQDYFQQRGSYKEQFITGNVMDGHYHLPTKELFVTREEAVPHELAPCIPTVKEIHQFGLGILNHIADDLRLLPGTLLQHVSNTALAGAEKNYTHMRLTTYKTQAQLAEEFATPIHEDLSLLTLVFRSNIPCLECYDFTGEGQWINVEESMVATDVVVMVGVSLEKLTNNYYLAAPHRVRGHQQARTSIAYHLGLNFDAKLNSNDFETSVTGRFSEPFDYTTRELLDHEMAIRTSVNGAY